MKIEVHRELSEGARLEWDRYFNQAPHQHPRQDPTFASLELANGNEPIYVIGRRNEKVCAIGVFSRKASSGPTKGHSFATSLSGPLSDDIDTLISFLSHLAKHPLFSNTGALKITPYWLGSEAKSLSRALQENGWKRSDSEPLRHTGLIDLNISEENLRSNLSRSARRKIKAVEQREIVIRKILDPAEAKKFFLKLDQFILSHHGLTPISENEQKEIFEKICCNPKLGALLGAFDRNTFLGGFLIYRSSRVAHAARYVADLDNANVRVAPSLWLEGMLWAKRQGCLTMDVEGYEDISDTEHPKFNIYEYKRQLRPVHVERVAEHVLPINAPIYFINHLTHKAKSIGKRAISFGMRS
jgi:lipid II:glycine glycyltransferase (peptidoglycan interpeptide bridge formation enzyme)